ncbi:hypothetical protein Tco_0663330 [Tanacetum coccineum]
MVPPNNLGTDLNCKAVNEHRSMIGSLMHLTASRFDIQFSTCLCARYQANPKESYLIAVKRIFREPFTKSPNMYKEYLAEFWYSAKTLENSKVSFSIPTGGIYGEVGVNTFRNAIGAHYLPHSSEYVAPPSIDIIRPWFEIIRGKTRGFDQISDKDAIILHSLANGINIDYAMIFQAPKPSSNTERVPQGINPGAKPGYKKHSTSSKQPSVSSSKVTRCGSSKAPTGFKINHLKRNKKSSSSMYSNLSQTSAFTLVVAEMHKEEQQASGDPKSLGVTTSFIIHSESVLGYNASADSIAEADLGLSAPNDSIPQQQGMDEGTKNTSFNHISTEEETSRTIKLEDLAKLVSHVQESFKDLGSPEDDPIIVVDDSDEDEEADKDEVMLSQISNP